MTKTRTRRAPVRELLSVTAAAEYLGVSKRTIRRMIHAGHLKAYRIRRRGMIRVTRTDLDDMLYEVKPGDVQP
ncbi:helix-turn-helix domain-containing protein [Phytoactinopolyspora mesophila]|uniref:helix-turn-helix domain-containing protein n=1 Tax=Phytoactinopolyspora mesophila TaxID=2650750 RepID=UPI001C9E9E7D